MNGWTSLRNSWPTAPGFYKVWDCRKDVKTKLDFDGLQFAQSIIRYTGSGQGNFTVTHWKHIDSQPNPALYRIFPPME